MSHPWPPGTVTGLGSLPGTDPVEAVALVFGELPDLPQLPELPARGPGADLIGRTAGLLVDLAVELVPSGWRLCAHPGRDLRRAQDLLARDLDALETHAADYAGTLKAQAAGPWTLAAALELPNGHKVVSDRGAVRDLTASLTEGLAAHLSALGARVPAADAVLQLDEPSLPAVLGGRVPTPSGFGTVHAVEAVVAEEVLRAVLSAARDGRRVVHCCARDVPIALLRAAGANAISLDAGHLSAANYDPLGDAIDTGMSVWLGVLPAVDASISFDTAHTTVQRIWHELGFAEQQLATHVVPTPTCGLAGATPEYVRRVLAVLRDVGTALLDDAA